MRMNALEGPGGTSSVVAWTEPGAQMPLTREGKELPVCAVGSTLDSGLRVHEQGEIYSLAAGLELERQPFKHWLEEGLFLLFLQGMGNRVPRKSAWFLAGESEGCFSLTRKLSGPGCLRGALQPSLGRGLGTRGRAGSAP